ncbi:hypothetical protein M8J77_002577 [Diaphorina citri]|nr:hypothetical protein M8J77_002577 [Diaphorina citri]
MLHCGTCQGARSTTVCVCGGICVSVKKKEEKKKEEEEKKEEEKKKKEEEKKKKEEEKEEKKKKKKNSKHQSNLHYGLKPIWNPAIVVDKLNLIVWLCWISDMSKIYIAQINGSTNGFAMCTSISKSAIIPKSAVLTSCNSGLSYE